MIVRTLNPTEWEKYRALRLRALEFAPDAFCSTLASMQSKPEGVWRERLEPDQPGKLFFAERERTLVGMVSADGSGETGEITAMFVDESARGQGVGRALLGHALEHFRSLGLRTARLDVRPGQEGALAFYRRLGFVEAGVDSDGNLQFEFQLAPKS